MSSAQAIRQGQRRRTAGPMRLRLRRLWKLMYRPIAKWRRSRRSRRRRRNVERSRTWRHSGWFVQSARIITIVASALFILWVGRALLIALHSQWRNVPFNLDKACQNTNFSCDAASGALVPIFSIALASLVFLFFRLSRVRRPYVRNAKERPREIVETAGAIHDEVVGRDELCTVMMQDLRNRGTRRPHVVIGGVGTGKTALLVRLTELLAGQEAVPVPVRLRDATEQLDFRKLARDRFLADADTQLLSDTEGERVWRQLCKDDRVVVLADGLEEALIEGDAEKDRDTAIRVAIRRASRERLPLIIASRPHDPLRGMEAVIVELEPLSEEAALDYIQRAGPPDDEHRLDWIVETADVAETPLYLQIARELHSAGLMKYVSTSRDGEWLDIRGVDRAALRLRLLDTWTQALIRGRLARGLSLTDTDRAATVEHLSALACIGLNQDRLHVSFADLESALVRPGAASSEAGPAQRMARARSRLSPLSGQRDPAASPYLPLAIELRQRLQLLGRNPDVQLAATWGAQLGLVETAGKNVRFSHTIMQAYLGSRLIDVALTDDQYRKAALKDPGRELLIALVLRSRAQAGDARPNRRALYRIAKLAGNQRSHRDLLLKAARRRSDVKALHLYSAALDIDTAEDSPAHQAIADELQERWPAISARDPRTLEQAKSNLVQRFGEAARQITVRRGELRRPVEPAYRQLYCIICAEPSYPIRVAAAQQIGAGGDAAFDAIGDWLGPLRRPASIPGTGARAIRQRGAGGQAAKIRGKTTLEDGEPGWREDVLRAWLAPMLVGSITSRLPREAAQHQLEHWLALVEAQRRDNLRLSVEVALAQGFKYAANRRYEHSSADLEIRDYLAERAREMLRGTRFWFTRLTLLHALCLLSLSEDPDGHKSRGKDDADPRMLVEHWAAGPDDEPVHPFVREAGRLATLALETGQPDRFIWIDESGVVARVGSQSVRRMTHRKHGLWIPPSTGWSALDPRAFRLASDVLLLLNLAERGGRPNDRERYLQRTNRSDLPPCLTGKRDPLDPTRAVGMATATSKPGSNCKPGCPFELCPYPPENERSYRAELSEALCRRQQALVRPSLVRRRTAPWQEVLPGDLKRFWKQMGQRAQPAESGHEPATEPSGDRGAHRSEH